MGHLLLLSSLNRECTFNSVHERVVNRSTKIACNDLNTMKKFHSTTISTRKRNYKGNYALRLLLIKQYNIF